MFPVKSDSSPAETSVSMSPWWWVMAGLIAAVLVPITVRHVQEQYTVPLPALERYLNVRDPEINLKAKQLVVANRMANHHRVAFAAGAVLACVFGLFSGLISRQFRLGILGALVGVATAYLLPMFTINSLIDLEMRALGETEKGDLLAIRVHTTQWLVLGGSVVVAAFIGSRQFKVGMELTGAAIVSAMIAGALYVMASTMMDPFCQPSNLVALEGIPRYLWTSVSPLLIGVFMFRA